KLEPKSVEVFHPVYVSLETISTILNLSDHIINLLQNRNIKGKMYPRYHTFINIVALHILEHREGDYQKTLCNLIKTNFGADPVLYEIMLKLPLNVYKDINRKLTYYGEYNDYNFVDEEE